MNPLINSAITTLNQGGIIAYPTEAVYGLGCDPWNEAAVLRLLNLKKRAPDKGLILIGSSWEQLKPFAKPIAEEFLLRAKKTWPGPFTWVFPKASNVPDFICGNKNSVALRVTDHPIAKEICEAYGHAIVSTSANIEGHMPAKSSAEVLQQFPTGIDFIVTGKVGTASRPSKICDIMSGEIFRA